VLFGGFRYYMEYRNIVEPGLPLNENTLHFFSKEYIQRVYLGLTVKQLPDETDLPSFSIFSDEHDLESLGSDLPSSAKTRFIAGHVQIDDADMSSEMEFRYRGGLPLHWLYKKKSFRVKLPPYTTYKGERQFNLVNPSTIHTVTDLVSYDMARSVGLLTPDYYPARVYVNNENNGLHFFLSRVDESFLRKQRRMPGSIYSGDTKYVSNPFGADINTFETVFKDRDNLPLIWKDERLWSKGASRNAEKKNDRRDIRKFIEIVNEKSAEKFMDQFITYFDIEKYYLYWGIDTLLGTNHHDFFHNHKLYFDPYKGKFEPIEWDIRYWTSAYYIKDIVLYPLLRQIKLNPVLEHERDLVTYGLLGRFSKEYVVSKIDEANEIVKPELEADPYRQASDSRYGRFEQDKVIPFFMDDYNKSIHELKQVYQDRHDYLYRLFDVSQSSYSIHKAGQDSVLLNVAVTGNTAIRLNPWSVVPDKYKDKVRIFKKYQANLKHSTVGETDVLYPGRLVSKGNIFNKVDTRSLLSYGKEKLLWSPLHYQYLIKGVGLSSLKVVEGLDASNAITGKQVKVDHVSELPSDKETASLHPWELWSSRINSKEETVILSGVVNVLEDKVYSMHQTVKIMPGTVFKIAENKSLFFFGRVNAEGTKASPISFTRLNKEKPWGAVVVQGKHASSSRFKYFEVSGGSIASYRLIDYPGQFNVHDVELFSLQNCTIEGNSIGDDALHIAYSKGEIGYCTFKNTAFDALDMDIAEVRVFSSRFTNIGNDALDLMTSNILVEDVFIEGAGDKCISVGEESEVSVKGSRLYQCLIGVAVKDKSKASLKDIEFKNIEQYAIDLYVKNPRYSIGGTIDGQRIKGINQADIRLDDRSKNHIIDADFLPAL